MKFTNNIKNNVKNNDILTIIYYQITITNRSCQNIFTLI